MQNPTSPPFRWWHSLPALPLLIAGILFAGHANAADRYIARYDAPSETMSVKACFGLPLPAHLVHHETASRFSDGMHYPGGQQGLRRNTSSSPTPAMGDQRCLQWQVDLGEAADAQTPGSRGQRDTFRVGPDLVMDPSLWLWRATGEREVRIRLELPGGIQASVPWEALDEALNGQPGVLEFRPQNTPVSWKSRFAIGNFKMHQVNVQGTTLRLAILGGLTRNQQEKLTHWIGQAAAAVGSVYGQFPRPSAQILVVPIGQRREPVPWAHIVRGGGPAAEFFVDENQPLEAFTTDWTACHELSHLLLPFVSSRDRWLSEGLASYYQYILLGRSGMLSEQQAWQGLYDGLQRGENGTRNVSLAAASLEGYRDIMRVYWSGAAMMLMADVQLRTQSNGARSLDTVLAGLQGCCLNSNKSWRARDVFAEMDRISGTQIFSELYARHVSSEQFPATAQIWKDLGINTANGRIRFMAGPEASPLQSAIMDIEKINP